VVFENDQQLNGSGVSLLVIVLLESRWKERFCTRTMARDPIPGIIIDTGAKK